MAAQMTYNDFQNDLNQGIFQGLKCEKCATVAYPPRGVCANCGGRQFAYKPLEGKGVLRTFTVVRVAPLGFKPPYVVAMVELSEGPWVVGNLLEVDPNQMDLSLLGRSVTLASQPVPPQGAYHEGARVLAFRLN